MVDRRDPAPQPGLLGVGVPRARVAGRVRKLPCRTVRCYWCSAEVRHQRRRSSSSVSRRGRASARPPSPPAGSWSQRASSRRVFGSMPAAMWCRLPTWLRFGPDQPVGRRHRRADHRSGSRCSPSAMKQLLAPAPGRCHRGPWLRRSRRRRSPCTGSVGHRAAVDQRRAAASAVRDPGLELLGGSATPTRNAIRPCCMPQNSAHWPGIVPGDVGLEPEPVSAGWGRRRACRRTAGSQKLCTTSAVVIRRSTVCPTGTCSSLAVTMLELGIAELPPPLVPDHLDLERIGRRRRQVSKMVRPSARR